MNFSFKSIKDKLVDSLSDKFTKKQVEDAFDIAQENLVNAFQEKKIEEENALKQYVASDEYAKMKNLSYWIFNNYGIPDDHKCVFSIFLGGGFVLSDKNENKEKLHLTIKSGILGRAYTEIVKEYLTEYTNGYIAFSDDLFSSDNLSKTDSIFEKIEKEVYPDYKYSSDYLKLEYGDTHSLFINFKLSENVTKNDKGKTVIIYAEEKIRSYISTYGNDYRPKLLLPISGLIFDSIDKQKIAEDAESWNLPKEELLSEVEHCIETINSNGFITVGAVYQSEYLMSFVLFRRVWFILSPDNEIIIIDMLNTHLNNLPSYYGNGAYDILKKAQQISNP